MALCSLPLACVLRIDIIIVLLRNPRFSKVSVTTQDVRKLLIKQITVVEYRISDKSRRSFID